MSGCESVLPDRSVLELPRDPGSAPGVSGRQFDDPPDERIRLRLPVGHEGLPDVHRARRQGQ